MPVTESTAGSILRPYYGLARLFAATEHWQTLTDTGSEDDALATISHPDYRVLDEGSCVRVPLIVISNPIDLSQTIYKRDDAQGRNDFGSLLVSFVLQRRDDLNETERLREFMADVETVIDQAKALADELHESEEFYYQNLDHFELAIAAGECNLHKLAGIDRANQDDNPEPQVVCTCAFVAHWI